MFEINICFEYLIRYLIADTGFEKFEDLIEFLVVGLSNTLK